jgi:hypothetical protein
VLKFLLNPPRDDKLMIQIVGHSRIDTLELQVAELRHLHQTSVADTTTPLRQIEGASCENESPGASSYSAAPEKTSSQGRDPVDAGLLTIETAEHIVDTYKSTMTMHFPFVIIPPETRAEDLRSNKPTLFLAVLAAASFHNTSLQWQLAMQAKEAINHQTLSAEKIPSVEVLEALLVFLAWYVALILDTSYKRNQKPLNLVG